MDNPRRANVVPDEIDLRIVAALQANARSTYGEIGQLAGLSAPAVKRRIDRLLEDGIILGFTAIVDQARVGWPFEAFTELRFPGHTPVDSISQIGQDMPEVLAVFTLAGDPDALAWLRLRDVRDLKRVIDQLRGQGPIIGTKTMMVVGARRLHGGAW